MREQVLFKIPPLQCNCNIDSHLMKHGFVPQPIREDAKDWQTPTMTPMGKTLSKQLLTGHGIGYWNLPVCVNAALIGGITTGRGEGDAEGEGVTEKKNKDGSVDLGTNYRKDDSEKSRF